MDAAQMERPCGLSDRGTCCVAITSKYTICSSGVALRPPNSGGQPGTRYPASNSSRWNVFAHSGRCAELRRTSLRATAAGGRCSSSHASNARRNSLRCSSEARRTASGSRFRVARLAEHALRDHVALDLARAAGNRETARRQEALLPSLGFAVEHCAVGTVERHPHLLHPLLVLHAEQLAHARTAAGIDTRQRAKGGEVTQQRDRLRLGDQVTEACLEARRERLAALVTRRDRPDQRLDAVAERRAGGHGHAFVGER